MCVHVIPPTLFGLRQTLYIYISGEIWIEHPSVGLASLAQLMLSHGLRVVYVHVLLSLLFVLMYNSALFTPLLFSLFSLLICALFHHHTNQSAHQHAICMCCPPPTHTPPPPHPHTHTHTQRLLFFFSQLCSVIQYK